MRNSLQGVSLFTRTLELFSSFPGSSFVWEPHPANVLWAVFSGHRWRWCQQTGKLPENGNEKDGGVIHGPMMWGWEWDTGEITTKKQNLRRTLFTNLSPSLNHSALFILYAVNFYFLRRSSLDPWTHGFIMSHLWQFWVTFVIIVVMWSYHSHYTVHDTECQQPNNFSFWWSLFFSCLF